MFHYNGKKLNVIGPKITLLLEAIQSADDKQRLDPSSFSVTVTVGFRTSSSWTRLVVATERTPGICGHWSWNSEPTLAPNFDFLIIITCLKFFTIQDWCLWHILIVILLELNERLTVKMSLSSVHFVFVSIILSEIVQCSVIWWNIFVCLCLLASKNLGNTHILVVLDGKTKNCYIVKCMTWCNKTNCVKFVYTFVFSVGFCIKLGQF